MIHTPYPARCPFCGSVPITDYGLMKEYDYEKDVVFYEIACGCGASMCAYCVGSICPSEAKMSALQRWNSRHGDGGIW